MKMDELRRAIIGIDSIGPEFRKDPAIERAVVELRKKLARKGTKGVLDEFILDALVYLIELLGVSGRKSFQLLGSPDSKLVTEARAKALWYEIRKNNLGVIEDIRQSHAYYLVSSLMVWGDCDITNDFPSPPPGSFLESFLILENSDLNRLVVTTPGG